MYVINYQTNEESLVDQTNTPETRENLKKIYF